MRARSATVGDLETVFCDLSKRMVAEYITAGKDAKLAYDDLMMNMKEGRAHALVQGDDVVAIISWRESDDATNTLFAAKDEFFSAKTVRFCKKHIRKIQALSGNMPIHSRIWLDRPEIIRWFQIIGYHENGNENGAKLYKLPPTSDARA
ncbi:MULTISPECIES: hypothetical protein [Brucella]|nr:hypothetical protein [Brucella abortus]ERM86590.1 hypothetical protein P865_06705 [Brucella abortus 82]ERT80644.1 hypothetical protein P050_02211 [Brucella abortus 90-12178]ERT98919.1 hypothetical protein P038_02124 [Brucella abortus 99-9971-135]AKO29878.1 hypothetical protein BAB8416_II0742 [Brucella abortus]ASU73478.1 hypothetical protein CJP69_14905 [Brucella abortus]